jgi:hypothetical protein
MSDQVLSAFHPAVAGWFRSRFPEPTEAQTRAWAVTSQHRNALISAPTGSGKALAAFQSAINDLVVEGLSRGLADEVHVPIAVQAGGEVRFLKEVAESSEWEIRNLLIQRQGPGVYLAESASSH